VCTGAIKPPELAPKTLFKAPKSKVEYVEATSLSDDVKQYVEQGVKAVADHPLLFAKPGTMVSAKQKPKKQPEPEPELPPLKRPRMMTLPEADDE
jgi:hypothetical protein